MNNNLVPLTLLERLTKSSTLHNIMHTSNVTLNTINNLIPLYSNIKPVIGNINTLRKAFKTVSKKQTPKTSNNTIIKEIKPIKKDKEINDSLSFFQ